MVTIIASLPAGKKGQAYSQTLGAEGGTTPYAWSTAQQQQENGLPPGVSLSSSGVLSGTIASGATASNYTCTLKVLDSGGTPALLKASITVS